MAGRGPAWLGMAGHGGAGLGMARLGEEGERRPEYETAAKADGGGFR